MAMLVYRSVCEKNISSPQQIEKHVDLFYIDE